MISYKRDYQQQNILEISEKHWYEVWLTPIPHTQFPGLTSGRADVCSVTEHFPSSLMMIQVNIWPEGLLFLRKWVVINRHQKNWRLVWKCGWRLWPRKEVDYFSWISSQGTGPRARRFPTVGGGHGLGSLGITWTSVKVMQSHRDRIQCNESFSLKTCWVI